MTPAELLVDAFERVLESGRSVVDGLSVDQLATCPSPCTNSVGWLVWHLARVQDDHVADAAGTEQVWTKDGFVERFDLPLDPSDTGYGHSADQVAKVRADAGLLAEYLTAVHERTTSYVGGLSGADLDRVVDERWDPPVTLGARLVSVVNDDTQHVGQAAYARGLVTG